MDAKIVLFDIDGTLLHSGFAGTRALTKAFKKIYGLDNALNDISMSGKTDRSIVREVLERAKVKEVVPLEVLFQEYIHRLKEEIKVSSGKHVKPGVIELLEMLHNASCVHLGLVTGNIKEGAGMKLAALGLDTYFEIGAYGSESEDRAELVRLAVKRANKRFRKNFQGSNIFVIGDSVHDITCGRSLGVVSIAVATGWTTWRELSRHNPTYLFKDFSDYRMVANIILEGK